MMMTRDRGLVLVLVAACASMVAVGACTLSDRGAAPVGANPQQADGDGGQGPLYRGDSQDGADSDLSIGDGDDAAAREAVAAKRDRDSFENAVAVAEDESLPWDSRLRALDEYLDTTPLYGGEPRFAADARALLDRFAPGAARSLPLPQRARFAALSTDDRAAFLALTDAQREALTTGNAAGACTAILEGHTDWVTSVAFSPNGPWALSGSIDGTTRVWRLDGAGGVVHAATLRGHTDAVRAVAFSRDGAFVLTGSDDHTVRLWRFGGEAGGTTARVLRGHDAAVTSVALSADGKRALSGSIDDTARLWPLDPGSPATPAPLTGHTDWVRSVALSPDGNWALTGGDDMTVCLWRIDPLRVESVTRLGELDGWVRAVAISPDGRLAIAASRWDTQLFLLDRNGSGTRTAELGGATSVAFSPDARFVVTGSQSHVARVWQLDGDDGATRIGRLDGSAAYAVVDFELEADEDATTARERWPGTGRMDVPGYRQRRAGGFTECWDDVRAVAISPDGNWALTASADTAQLWRLFLPER